MMNVKRGEPPLKTWCDRVQQMQENDGIHSAAQTYEDIAVGGEKQR
jgi:hypothetical protein